MPYTEEITQYRNRPEQMEALYQSARRERQVEQFSAELSECYQKEPDNLLYAAWYYRLHSAIEEAKKRAAASANWKLAVPLAIINGLIFWALSDNDLMVRDHLPVLALLGAPITAFIVMAFLALTAHKHYRRSLAIGAALSIVVALVFALAYWVVHINYRYYLDLMVPHIALLSWVAVGAALIGLKSSASNRHAFLIKSIEVFITGGLYLIAGVAFGMITLGMFAALSITLPDVLLRLIAAGGAGLIPVIAVVTIYDPTLEPEAQDFKQGLSRFISTMMRLLLPLTLGVLIIYILIIPFNFLEPYKNRDVLIVYNIMLFAVMGLLVGVTPIELSDLSPRLQAALRNGILAVAGLAALVSLYALSALVYRTVAGGITINRLTMLGWNVINISLLVLVLITQLRADRSAWHDRLKWVFSLGAYAYVGWTLFVILITPIIFR